MKFDDVTGNQIRDRETRSRIACGVCHQNFELREPDALYAHLNRHFDDLTRSPYRCDVCEINFMYASDLETHLNSAAKGNCGFKFVHKVPCSGHHPPTTLERPMDGNTCDDDRFNFSYRVSHWERAQLLGFISSIDRMVAVRLNAQDRVTNSTSGVDENRVFKFCRAWLSRSNRPGDCSEVRETAKTLTDSLRSVSTGKPRLRRSRSFTEGMPLLGHKEQCYTAETPDALEYDLRALLNQYPVDTSIYRRPWDGVLLRAAASGDKELISVALANGANVDGTDANGMSPLKLAATSGDRQSTELLLQKGANPALARDECKELFKLAIDTGDHSLLNLLLTAGGQPVLLLQRAVVQACGNLRDPDRERDHERERRTLSILCAHEPRLAHDDRQKFLKTVLKQASYRDIQWLLDSELRTPGQRTTILLAACENGYDDLVNLLCRRGVQVEDRQFPRIDDHPLYRAARLRSDECLQLMLKFCVEMTDARKRELLGQASLDVLAERAKLAKARQKESLASAAVSAPSTSGLHEQIRRWTLGSLGE